MKQGIINFGLWLTRIGEEKGIRPLIYNPITWGHFFVSARRCGAAFTAVLREQYPEVKTAVDVGAGTGGYVMRLKQAGVDAQGIEYSSFGRSLASFQGVDLKPFDCSTPDGVPDLGRHDLVFTIEVGEHLPESFSDAFVDSIIRYSNFVIFSAAQPGQGGHGHINEQTKEYWRAKFAARGYEYQEEATKRFSDRLTAIGYRGWMPANVQIFRSTAA